MCFCQNVSHVTSLSSPISSVKQSVFIILSRRNLQSTIHQWRITMKYIIIFVLTLLLSAGLLAQDSTHPIFGVNVGTAALTNHALIDNYNSSPIFSAELGV